MPSQKKYYRRLRRAGNRPHVFTGEEIREMAYKAMTGRVTPSQPNLQNIPIKTELGAAIRKAMTGV